MIKYLVFALFLFPIISNAQSKWDIGLMTSPDITKAHDRGEFKLKERLGYEVGISLYRKLSKSFYINSGLTISKRKSYHYESSYWDAANQQIDPSVKLRSYYNTAYLDVPMLLNYRLNISKKFSLTSSAGLIFGWIIKDTYTVKTNAPNKPPYDHTIRMSNGKRNEPDRLYLSYGLGGLYQINDKFSLMVMPNAMMSSYQTYSFNLRTSLLYNFKS